MTDRRIYTATVPSGAFQNRRGTSDVGRQLSKLSTLGGSGQVAATGGTPEELPVDGQFRGRFAEVAGREMQELLAAPDIETVPFYAIGTDSPADGYYVAESAGSGRVEPQTGGVVEFQGRLIREGTRNTHWLGLATGAYQPIPGNPFGSSTSALVGIPAAAEHVRAVDSVPAPTSRAVPSPVDTVEGEFGAVDLYDTDDLTFDPIYYYTLPYDLMGNVDAAVFDDYGTTLEDLASTSGATVGSATVGSATVGAREEPPFVHGQVFNPAHEFRGTAYIENGIFRLEVDDSTGHLRAERWNADWEEWRLVSLPSRSWEPEDLDVIELGRAAVRGQLEFVDADTGDAYALNFALHRGFDAIQWWQPDGESSAPPTGLEELLAPTAHDSDVDTQAHTRLVEREGVRK